MPRTPRTARTVADVVNDFEVGEHEHTDEVTAPPVAEHAASVVVAEEVPPLNEKLPTDFAVAVQMLQDAEITLPQVTRDQQRVRASRLAQLRVHVFQLQQGMPLVKFTADDQAKVRAGRIAQILQRI